MCAETVSSMHLARLRWDARRLFRSGSNAPDRPSRRGHAAPYARAFPPRACGLASRRPRLEPRGGESGRNSNDFSAGVPWPRPSPPSRTKWTRRVPHPVLIGHALASPLTPARCPRNPTRRPPPPPPPPRRSRRSTPTARPRAPAPPPWRAPRAARAAGSRAAASTPPRRRLPAASPPPARPQTPAHAPAGRAVRQRPACRRRRRRAHGSGQPRCLARTAPPAPPPRPPY